MNIFVRCLVALFCIGNIAIFVLVMNEPLTQGRMVQAFLSGIGVMAAAFHTYVTWEW